MTHDTNQPEWDPDEQELVRDFILTFTLGGAPVEEFRLPGPNGSPVKAPWKLWRVVAAAAAPGPRSPDYTWGFKMIRLLNESRCC